MRHRAHRASQDGGVFLLDLLSNALVAVMALMLIALSRMGPGGAESRPQGTERQRLAPVVDFVPNPEVDGDEKRLGIFVQAAVENTQAEAPRELEIFVDGAPALPDSVRVLRGLGREGSNAEQHHAALLLTPQGTFRRFDIGFTGSEAIDGLEWRVTAGREVILSGTDRATHAGGSGLLAICVEGTGRVTAGFRDQYLPNC